MMGQVIARLTAMEHQMTSLKRAVLETSRGNAREWDAVIQENQRLKVDLGELVDQLELADREYTYASLITTNYYAYIY